MVFLFRWRLKLDLFDRCRRLLLDRIVLVILRLLRGYFRVGLAVFGGGVSQCGVFSSGALFLDNLRRCWSILFLVSTASIRLLCRGGTFAIVGGLEPGDVLVGEGEHFGQEVVVVEILEVVNLVQHFEVVGGDFLDLGHHLLVLKVVHPELLVVVDVWVKLGWVILDRLETLLVLQHYLRRLLEVLCWDLRCDPIFLENINSSISAEFLENFIVFIPAHIGQPRRVEERARKDGAGFGVITWEQMLLQLFVVIWDSTSVEEGMLRLCGWAVKGQNFRQFILVMVTHLVQGIVHVIEAHGLLI